MRKIYSSRKSVVIVLFSLVVKTSELSILQAILSPTISRSDVKHTLVKLDVCNRHQVVLGVNSVKEEGATSYEVTIQCPTIQLLTQFKSAITRKVWICGFSEISDPRPLFLTKIIITLVNN